MSVIDVLQEALALEMNNKQNVQRELVKADEFSVTLHVHNNDEDTVLHDCGKDEYFYVIKGKVDMLVENRLIKLKEGESLLVKAGEKHMRKASKGTWIMMVSKQPHRHRKYAK